MAQVNGHKKRKASNGDDGPWSSPGAAEFDLRSDVVTKPTKSMLDAITHTTLLDDVFREDMTTSGLEQEIARMTGHEEGLLVMSGTMGNQLSIRAQLMQPPHSVLADSRSHIMGWEAGGIASLSGAFAIPVKPANGHHLTLRDIKTHTVRSEDIHACPTRLIALENTLGGTILPLEDCQAISKWARSQDPPILMHLDGARLWDAVTALAVQQDVDDTPEDRHFRMDNLLKTYAECFDTISLCFSKGLGAPIGSIIVGSSDTIARARHIRKSLGGGLRQAAVISAPALVSVRETFLAGKLAISHERARQIAKAWEKRGGKLKAKCETNMVWLDLIDLPEGWSRDPHYVPQGRSMESESRLEDLAREEGLRVSPTGRVVVHYQVSEEAVRRLEKVMNQFLGTV